MSQFRKEKWVDLYRAAFVELEHAKMAGRIGDARTEISARLEKLHQMPGLHAEERQAIEDAFSGLRTFEREEEQHEEDERRIAEAARKAKGDSSEVGPDLSRRSKAFRRVAD